MKRPASNRGVSLIEVLVALVIIAIGLLGIAKMQALAIAGTRGSSMRSLIAIEAASLASAMHANRAYWTNVATAATTFNVSVANAAVTAASDAALLGAVTNCASTACVGAPMALYDLVGPTGWGPALDAIASGSNGTVYCSGTPVACTITVNWQENLVGMSASTQNQTQTLQLTYSLLVQP